MTELQLARRCAAILVFGHLALFFFGLFVAFWGRFSAADVAQLILMGSPLLAVVSASGYNYILRTSTQSERRGKKVSKTVSNLTIIIIGAFIFALFISYSLALVDMSLITKEQLVITVGVIETTLGGYIGTIKDRIFPSEGAVPA